MTMDQKLAYDAVEKINSEIKYKWNKANKDKDFMPIVSITFADTMFFIGMSIPSYFSLDLPEIHLYNSVNSDRIYYEKSDTYESFYKLIKRKYLMVKDELNKVKL